MAVHISTKCIEWKLAIRTWNINSPLLTSVSKKASCFLALFACNYCQVHTDEKAKLESNWQNKQAL
jgi:hypothetical protein